MSEQSSPPRLVSRRRFVQGTAMAGFAAFLAACTGTKSSTAPSEAAPSEAAAASEAAPSVAASVVPTEKVVTGPLKFANWPAYIDQTTEANADTGVLPA